MLLHARRMKIVDKILSQIYHRSRNILHIVQSIEIFRDSFFCLHYCLSPIRLAIFQIKLQARFIILIRSLMLVKYLK